MIKRRTSLIFAIVMILNLASAFSVQAKDNEKWTPPENIVTHGDFSKANDKLYFFGEAGVSFISGQGADGKNGFARIRGGGGSWATMLWPVEMQKGETYTISFWAKRADESQTMNVFLKWGSSSSTTNLASSIPITDGWTKYTFEYTATGKDSKNADVDLSNTQIKIRPNPGNHNWLLYVDDLCVTPHGNVEYDYFHKDPYERPELYTGTGLPEPKGIEVITFLDTKNHWAEKNIELLSSAGYVEGMGDGTFAPAANVTRAEWVKMMVSIFNIKPSEYSNSFKDISADDWYADYVQTAYDCGLLDKIFTLSGEFNPNQPITREEAATVAWRVLEIKGYENPAKATNITDLGLVSSWAKTGIKKCMEYGVLNGYSDNTIKPKATITRAEAVSMFRRILEFENVFEVYVGGESGSDENPGTIEAPLATVTAAKEKIKPYLKDMKNNITVYIKGGVEHMINNPIEFTPEDSGCNGYNVIYTSYGEGKAILTSGRDYTSWQLHDAESNIYKTFVGTGVKTRNVYINGVRARRARTEPVQKTAPGAGGPYRDGFLNDVVEIPTGFECSNVELLELSHPEDVEFVHTTEFYYRFLRSEKIERTENGKVQITFSEPGLSQCRYTSVTPMNDATFVENAYELLDVPGEWFLNIHDGYLYYIPREYENPADMIATIPEAESIIKMTGTFYNKMHNIKIKNLLFEYTGWDAPIDLKFASAGQNGDFAMRGGYDVSLAPGVIDINHAIYVDVEDCVIRKSGSGGIRYVGAIQYCNVLGNEVYDVSANGIVMGDPREDELTTRLPENFAYETTDINIINNYIHDIGKEYSSSAAFSFSWPKNTRVAHNEIANTSYDGMHIGWGFNKYDDTGTNLINTVVEKNYIHDLSNLRHNDGGGIYTLGATGYANGYDRTKLQYNYFENKGSLCTYLYLDEGSYGWEVTGNVIDHSDNYYRVPAHTNRTHTWLSLWTGTIHDNFIYDNYTTTDSVNIAAPNNVIGKSYIYKDANWPAEAQKIKDEAGLKPEYVEKYPCGVQHLRLRIGDLFPHNLDVGDTLQIEFEAYGRKKEKIPVAKDEVYYYSSDKSIATVDKNGLITARGNGECNVYVTYLEGDLERQEVIELAVGDTVKEILPPEKDIYLIYGLSEQLKTQGLTTYNEIVDIKDFEYEIADESIATVDENGVITAHALGRTTMKSIYRADGVELETEHLVVVSEYTHSDTQEFIDSCEKVHLKAGDSLFDIKNWSAGASESQDGEDGVHLADKSVPVFIDQAHFGANKLVSFDIIIKDPNSWPSIALNAVKSQGNYKINDQYMIGFKPDIIEIQRWNNGERTMIFGPSDYAPYGPGVLNEQPDGSRLFDYGTRYTLTVGTFDVENGTRIILMIDGKPIIDYTDTGEGALKSDGYFGAYALMGYFELLPSTDKQN